ncbi:DUF6509 family protein [Paenibacillus flagellatus]|uniref:Pullulanase n=1 Tax=Paenibacillus flagellatus TaxID=2211139 RepID=A0A2V5KZS0_9BACL|nr:DUF6509 family protein [Paenibacillus flagellatus]PYI55706.1 pullulanase [Paenibacillus flagellatus]
MIDITAYSVERVRDPFGILPGQRYEFVLDIEVDEEDEIHSENGLFVRVIYAVEPERTGIVKYELFERTTETYLPFDLEDDEVEAIDAFCRDRLSEADGNG